METICVITNAMIFKQNKTNRRMTHTSGHFPLLFVCEKLCWFSQFDMLNFTFILTEDNINNLFPQMLIF